MKGDGTVIKITNVQYLQERSVGMSKEDICAKYGIANTKSLRDYYLPMWGLRTADDEIKALREYRGIKMPPEKKRTIFDKPKEANIVADHKEVPETKEEPAMNTETIINQQEDTSFAAEVIKEDVNQHERNLVSFWNDMIFLALDALADGVYKKSSEHAHPTSDTTFSDRVALLHGEISNMYDAYKNQGGTVAVEDEAAEVIIRLLDTCRIFKLDIAGAVMRRHAQ